MTVQTAYNHIQISHDSIIELGEELYQLAKCSDILKFEKKLPEYTNVIEKHFTVINNKKLSSDDVDKLETILTVHKKISRLIDRDKESISKKLKQLHAGKAMQSVYPQK